MYAHQRSLSRFAAGQQREFFSRFVSLERIAREISPKSIFSGISD
jgi:hypothetical protein